MKKWTIILIVLIILLLIFINNNNNVSYEGNSDNKQINYKLTEENQKYQMSISKLEEMRKIQRGTSYIDIVSRFGEPDEELGSGFLIVGYKFSESKLILHFP